jgi:hypothetical protein
MSHHRGKIWPGRADMPARPGKPLVRADSGYQSNQTHPAASSRPNRYSVAGDSISAESLRVTTGGSRPAPCSPCRPHPSRFSGSSPFNALRPGIQRTPPRRRANEQMRERGRAESSVGRGWGRALGQELGCCVEGIGGKRRPWRLRYWSLVDGCGLPPRSVPGLPTGRRVSRKPSHDAE